MHRRDFIIGAAAFAAVPFTTSAATLDDQSFETDVFDYAWLKGRARSLAGRSYQTPGSISRQLENLSYDQYQSIRFRREHSLWAKENLLFQLRFFHLGRGFKETVRLFEINQGRAREILYDPAMFDFGSSGIRAGETSRKLGFAGFRIQFHSNWENDVAAFLGASYFRAVGGEGQYGLSARGLAIDTGLPRAEEFPVFNAYWIERPQKASDRLTIYALLDSPSIAGAYRFDIRPGATLTMDIDAALYPRKRIERLGIAPLSSMYQHGENDQRMANDWRPEIHDSDGLSMWSGSGEWIWRPLSNPTAVRVNSYFDDNPRGFGLLQRDRNFDHYQDDGVFYERRPGVWIEPRNPGPGWGKGAVQLVEIPTVDETFDNIVTYWNPAITTQSGQELLFSYRLHWGAQIPVMQPLAQVMATRTGIGGIVGQKRKYFSRRFVVDFAGGQLPSLARQTKIEPVITASRGQIEITSVRPLDSISGFRAMFDLRPTDNSVEPIDLRLFLRSNGQALSETWIYQYAPPPPEQRR